MPVRLTSTFHGDILRVLKNISRKLVASCCNPHMHLGRVPDMSFSKDIVFLILLIFITIALWYHFERKRCNPQLLPLPPGPPGLPLIGNVLDIPKDYEYLQYNEWRNVYGAHNLIVIYVPAIFLHELYW